MPIDLMIVGVDHAPAAVPVASVETPAAPLMIFDRHNGETVEAIDQAVADLHVLRGLLVVIPWNRPVVNEQFDVVREAVAEIWFARGRYVAADDAMAADPEGVQ